MRRSRAEADKTREAIVRAAARLIRERGIAATSIGDVTAAAGITHGGFYRHVDSKEALVAEALDAAAADSGAALERAAATAGRRSGFAARIEQYLSPAHCDNPGRGCPIAALATEIGREPGRVRRAFGGAVERMAATLARELPADGSEARPAALRAMAMMVGAVALARATKDAALAGELLAAVRAELAR